ncbi:MAG: hypothetical protein ACOYI8_08700 [Christensenellales bacterium]|jgi:putative aldouronate transport system substrate-binding protein
MTKKLVAMALAALMCLASVAAVAEANLFGWDVPAEPLTIDITAGAEPTENQQIVGVENMLKFMLDNFNVQYNLHYFDSDTDEQYNLMLASDDYPEIVVGASTPVRQKFVEQGRAQDLTDYLAQSENILHRLNGLEGLYADDNGRIFYLPESFSNLPDLPDYSAHIRFDEWQEIGSPAITTPEEYFDAIMTVYELHPTTAAGEQRYTLGLYNQGMPEDLAGYFGLQKGWKINDDDSLTYWTHTEEGKKMAKFFNDWWRTGTMDPDSFTNEWNDLRTKITQERVIAMIGGWWIGYNAGHEVWMLTDDNWFEEKRFIQVGFKDADAENAYVTMKNNAGGSWVVITDKCQNVADVMKWIDFTMTDKGIALTCWGMPNEVQSYSKPDTTKCIWELYDDGSWKFNEQSKQELITETWDYQEEGIFGANGGLFNIINYRGRFDDGIHCLWGNQMWYSEATWKKYMFENMSGTIFDGTALLYLSIPMEEDVTFAQTAIKDAWKQYYPLAVMADSDDAFEEAWLNLQAAVEGAGLETYTEYRADNYRKNLEMMGK